MLAIVHITVVGTAQGTCGTAPGVLTTRQSAIARTATDNTPLQSLVSNSSTPQQLLNMDAAPTAPADCQSPAVYDAPAAWSKPKLKEHTHSLFIRAEFNSVGAPCQEQLLCLARPLAEPHATITHNIVVCPALSTDVHPAFPADCQVVWHHHATTITPCADGLAVW